MEADFKHTIRFYLHWITYLVHNLAWIANNLAQIKKKCDLNSNLLFNHFLLDISSLCLIMMFNQNITLIYYILFNIRLFKKISHLGCQALLLQCMPPTNVSLVRSPGYLWFLKLHHPPPPSLRISSYLSRRNYWICTGMRFLSHLPSPCCLWRKTSGFHGNFFLVCFLARLP